MCSGSYLFEDERLVVVVRVNPISGDHAGLEPLTDGVGGQTVHLHFYVGSYLLIGQQLSTDHLHSVSVTSYCSINDSDYYNCTDNIAIYYKRRTTCDY